MLITKLRSESGFTLIEMLIVMGILSALSGLTAYQFTPILPMVTDLERRIEKEKVEQAIDAYNSIDVAVHGEPTIAPQETPEPVDEDDPFSDYLDDETEYSYTWEEEGENLTITDPVVCEVWVDDDFNESTPGWDVDHFDTIQEGVEGVCLPGTVWVHSGLYYEQVTIDQRDITIRAMPGEHPIVDGGGTISKVMIIKDTENVTIDGLEIRNGTGDLLRADYVTTLVLRNLECHDSSGDEGAQAKHCTFVTVENSSFYNNAGDGCSISYGVMHTVRNNICYNNSDRGIYLYGDWPATPLINCVIEGNECSGSGGTVSDAHVGGIIVYYVCGATIRNNTCYDNVGPGINVYKENFGYSSTSLVTNNICYNNVDGNAPGNGIRLFLAWNTTVLSNECYGNASAGIRLAVDYDEFTKQNLIVNNNLHDNTGVGIWVEDDCYDNEIYSNTIVDNSSGARDDNLESPANQWDSGTTGNTWSDFTSNPGYPNTYNIPGVAGSQDNHPEQAS